MNNKEVIKHLTMSIALIGLFACGGAKLPVGGTASQNNELTTSQNSAGSNSNVKIPVVEPEGTQENDNGFVDPFSSDAPVLASDGENSKVSANDSNVAVIDRSAVLPVKVSDGTGGKNRVVNTSDGTGGVSVAIETSDGTGGINHVVYSDGTGGVNFSVFKNVMVIQGVINPEFKEAVIVVNDRKKFPVNLDENGNFTVRFEVADDELKQMSVDIYYPNNVCHDFNLAVARDKDGNGIVAQLSDGILMIQGAGKAVVGVINGQDKYQFDAKEGAFETQIQLSEDDSKKMFMDMVVDGQVHNFAIFDDVIQALEF